ncbi:hypothetical protein NE237_028991 [Protea cynaroides]|uniref:FAD-binding PCMH-type domain-containing protein n=1 Tax=Protea cynaroides TaxID=273540 RepID=A0A9Q0JTE5_9MAGN|nr:hypothetical protein NE237_028991 [Protea cynaroides]
MGFSDLDSLSDVVERKGYDDNSVTGQTLGALLDRQLGWLRGSNLEDSMPLGKVVASLVVLLATDTEGVEALGGSLAIGASDTDGALIDLDTCQQNSSYSTILQSSIQNLRILSSTTPKPQFIITPLNESHVQAAVICSRQHGFQIRVRSGGHDYEGLSSVSDIPFIIVDMSSLRSVDVNVDDQTAWVQSGAAIGELYYRIAEKSRKLGFPAGVCDTIGVGGHFSGGGYGFLTRKYGLASDNIIDARIIDVNGKILNRESMGEDLFWAIRGAGAAGFGIILSWKIKLVPVPDVVTVFILNRPIEEGASKLVYRWQHIADKLNEDLFVRITISSDIANKTINAAFESLYLGGVDELLQLMEQSFPELGLKKNDCTQMSWIESIIYLYNLQSDKGLEVLLEKNQRKSFYKAKSDYVKEPISEIVLEGIWERFRKVEVPVMILTPNGGKMKEISEQETPYPHREGNIYEIQYLAYWDGGDAAANENINWIKELYSYMTPHVSKSPRAAYANYRDLDLGTNENCHANCPEAMDWGHKYFKSNFERLVQVKTKVDPTNFFRHEQSIPPLTI